MNERIKELAIEAEIYAMAEYEKWTPNDDFSGVPHIRNICNEKFAELIVAECISVMKSTVDESIDFERKLDETSSWIESDIKKHFGVDADPVIEQPKPKRDLMKGLWTA
jgi:hypothetical protein